jgi:hypothetical protein
MSGFLLMQYTPVNKKDRHKTASFYSMLCLAFYCFLMNLPNALPASA